MTTEEHKKHQEKKRRYRLKGQDETRKEHYDKKEYDGFATEEI